MRAHLPFIARCPVKMKGRSKKETKYVTFQREFEIPEADLDDAPVVAEVMNEDGSHAIARFRASGGRFYSQLRRFDDVDGLAPNSSVENLLAGTRPEDDTFPFGDLFQRVAQPDHLDYATEDYMILGEGDYATEDSVGKFLDHSEDEIARQYAIAKQIYGHHTLIIGETVYCEVDEPRLAIDLTKRDRPARIDVLFEAPHPDRSGGFKRTIEYKPPYDYPTFRLDRLDDLKDYVRERYQSEDLPFSGTGLRVNLVAQEVLRFDDEADNAIRSGWATIEKALSELLRADTRLQNSWQNMQQACIAAEKEPTEKALETLIETMKTHAERTNDNQVRAALEDILSRWQLRPLNAVVAAPVDRKATSRK